MKIIRALKSARTSDLASLEARRNPERKLGEFPADSQIAQGLKIGDRVDLNFTTESFANRDSVLRR